MSRNGPARGSEATGGAPQGPSAIVYTCTFDDYDYNFGPLVRTPNTRFLRYGTSRPNRWRIWEHLPVPDDMALETQTLTNRRFKFLPGAVLPDCDVAIYVDGTILVRADLSPLIAEFWDSGADIALFPHPSGRTVEQEMDFALEHKTPARDIPLMQAQRDRYREMGLLDMPVTENTIIFYRMAAPKVAEIGTLWWEEFERFSKRDQISLPYVRDRIAPKVHLWDWHFHAPSDRNRYFARAPHRRPSRLARLRAAAFFMKDHALEYRALHGAIKAAGALRKLPGGILRMSRAGRR